MNNKRFAIIKNLFLLIAALVLGQVFVFAHEQQQTRVVSLTQQTANKDVGLATLELNSQLMQRKMPYAVILPANYEIDKTRKFPIVYFLHGLSGHYNDWMHASDLANFAATKHQFIVVLVEGENGWYVDSATKQLDKYESYIVEELLPEVDRKFRTLAKKESRAVAGLSMGGYGAIKFGLKYPDKFRFAGSMSGALSAARYPTALMLNSWGLIKTSLKTAFGATESEVRRNNDIFEIVRKLTPEQKSNLPYFYLDCGTEDFLIADNRDFADLLFEKKIPHEFRQLPGAHNWQYWNMQSAEILRILDSALTPQAAISAEAH